MTAIETTPAAAEPGAQLLATSAVALPGHAGEVARFFGDRLRVVDFYGPHGSAVYDELTRHDQSEIAELVRLLRHCDGAVLELACGSGRITLPLLACGRDVVAVDNSGRMLELLDERLATPRGKRFAAA